MAGKQSPHAYLSSDTLMTPSSFGMMTAALTTSWKASILLSRHGFRACGCGRVSDAIGRRCRSVRNDCGAGTHNLSLLLRRNPQPGANELAVSGLEGSRRSTRRCDDGRPRRLAPCSSQMTAPTHAPACRHTPLPSNKIKVPVSFYRLVFTVVCLLQRNNGCNHTPGKKLKGASSNFEVSVQSF